MDVNKTFHFMATEPQKQEEKEKKNTPTLEGLKALSSLQKSSRFRAIFQ